jgi:hypothetical protein
LAFPYGSHHPPLPGYIHDGPTDDETELEDDDDGDGGGDDGGNSGPG